MIRNHWYAVLDGKQLKKKHQVYGVIRLGEKLVFWRDSKNNINCISDICVHRGAALSKGRIINDHIQCPFHGLEYDALGKCVLIPAYGKNTPVPERFKVISYPVREAHGFIWIWWGELRETYPDLPWFDDLDENFHYYTLYDHWNTHYSRVIENQLDVVHLPFVHHNTIGRGNRTVVDGPIVKIEDSQETVWVFNRKDDGNIAVKAEALHSPRRHPNLTFKFPHIWMNWIAEKIRIVIAFTPIDNENSLIYIRYYHKTTSIPLLKHFMSWSGKVLSRVIAHQDRRVVETQQPKRTQYKMGEQLIQGDSPIVLYRKRRQELIDLNNTSQN